MDGRTQIGLLGFDPRIGAVAAAARQAGVTLAIGYDLPADSVISPLLGDAPPRAASWEQLLDDTSCTAVLVGGDQWRDTRAEAVRGLVQAGRTLLLSHPLTLSMLWAYELDMIRADSGARLIPDLPDRLHPFIARLRGQVEAAIAAGHPFGPLEKITMERRMADRSRESVLRQLARDVDLVRVLAGDPQRLATLGGTIDSAWPTLAVEFTGSRQVPVRWSVARGAPSTLTITLFHDHGSTSVTIPDDARPWTWHDDPGADSVTNIAFDRGGVMLAQLPGPVGQPIRGGSPASIPRAEWADAARAIELAETVPRSLTKGRAIDLHQEEYSEIGTFKGTMASLGCGIVLAALFVLVLAAVVGGVAREADWAIGERIAGAWPLVVLAALVVFLALQVLPLLVGATPPPDGDEPSRAHPGDREADRP